jgi:hypothetical protein
LNEEEEEEEEEEKRNDGLFLAARMLKSAHKFDLQPRISFTLIEAGRSTFISSENLRDRA